MASQLSIAIREVIKLRPNFRKLVDFRQQRSTTISALALLSLHVVSWAAGSLALRHKEQLVERISPKRRKQLNLPKKASDSTLSRIANQVGMEGVSQALESQVRVLSRQGGIENDLFAGGVLAVDGKTVASGMGDPPSDQCRRTVCDAQGTPCWYLHVLRAVLVSCSAAVCLAQKVVPSNMGEANTFPEFFKKLIDGAGARLFRYVSLDAGLSCLENARLVYESGRRYICRIKENFPKQYPAALEHLRGQPVEAETEERCGDVIVSRQLSRVPAGEWLAFPDAQQAWMVLQTTVNLERGVTSYEVRIYFTNVRWNELSPTRILKLIRLHWGIENCSNWTADVLYGEDKHTSKVPGHGLVVLSILRMMAMNVAAMVRAKLPRESGRLMGWKLVWMTIRDALIQSCCRCGELPANLS